MLRRFTAWLGRNASARPERSAVVEEVEPRILYSADLNPALWVGDGAQASAIVGAVNPDAPATVPVVAAQQQERQRHEIVFVDAAVPDAQQLIDGMRAARPGGTTIEFVQLSAGTDGLTQIGEVLANECDLDAIHIVSHGGPGRLQLGNSNVDMQSLQGRSGEIESWRATLTVDADLMLYGCNVAEGAVGEAFMKQLAALSGTDVAASDDATGAADAGGDWQLEASTGRIEAAVAIGAQAQAEWAHLLAVAIDSTSTGTSTGGSFSVSHTTAGTDRLMLVGVSMNLAGANSVSSITYNGASLSLVGTRTDGDARIEIWSLVAPTVGTFNVDIAISGTSDGNTAGVMTFTGVNQTTALGAFVSNSGIGGSGSVTVGSATGELVFGAIAVDDAANYDLIPGSGQAEHWDLVGGPNINGGGSTKAGAASVGMSWTWPGSDNWSAAGVSIKPAVISVTPTAGLSTTEAGGMASFNVALTSAPTANVTIPVSSSDTSEGTVSTSLLTFTTANWSTPQVITVTGVDDALADGFQGYSIVLGAATSSDANYNGVNPSDVQVANADNDINYGLITVNTTADTADGDTSSLAALAANRGADGTISLREAITAANNTANGAGGADRIYFNIAGTGAHTINVASALPAITGALVIDASTDDSFTANANRPAIILDGNNSFTGDGLVLSSTADGSTIRGFVIRDFGGDGIEIQANSDGNTIAGNYIGRLTSGGIDAGAGEENAAAGIRVLSSGNTIGGTTAADRNVISANALYGVSFEGTGANSNTVAGNFIGLSAAGTAMLGNSNDGVFIIDGASNNTIGGATTAHRNVIAGNSDGVQIGGVAGGSNNNIVQNNYIGTDVTGTVDFGNNDDGVDIDNAALNNQVIANLIAGNTGDGIDLGDAGASTGTIIRSNLIGTQADGVTARGNSGAGILIGNGGTANNTTIGGAAAGQGNTIAFNAGDGIFIPASTSVAILGNAIHSNTGQGIDLGTDGVTANDAGDADAGANNLQNFAVLTSANSNATGTTIVGSLNSNASTTYRIEFFSNRPSVADASNGEGERYLGFITVTTDGSGNATINTTLANAWVNSGDKITATATVDLGGGSFGSTSEFAANVTATSTGIVVVDTTSDTYDSPVASGTVTISTLGTGRGADGRISLREAINAVNNTANGGTPDKIVFAIPAALSGGVHTINVGAAGLPTITQAVIIDASSEPDFSGSPVIELNGGNLGSGIKGITLGAGSDGSTIRGLIINRFSGTGIEISGSNNHTIQGNWIGLDSTGLAAAANGVKGIYALNSTGNLIGGTTAATRNVISGNAQQGIYFDNVDNSTISGNYVGTNVAGTGDVTAGGGNSLQSGVFLTNGSSGNVVGGTSAAARNVLSGNNHFGFEVLFGSQNNLLQGNYIGTDATGLVALGNVNGGAVFWNAGTGNVFGGSVAGARNVIAGNTFNGVVVGSASTGATIQGNYIGVGADGVTALGNGSSGVKVEGGSTGTRIGTNADGSNDAAEGNVISGNTYGVRITDSGTTGTVIAGNTIGLAVDGNTIVANSSTGVTVSASATNTTIGGATSVSRNVISGNASFGVYFDSTTSGNSVMSNYIGTNAAGNAARANLDGVWIDGSANNTIGQAGAGNLISGNTYYGVVVDAAAATGNTIRSNLIGTDAAGTTALGNGAQGILVSNGASATSIGGTTAGQGNTVAFNAGDGIHVSSGTGVSILGNSIHSNTDLGIDLGANGFTVNDVGDADSGANALQNFPVLSGATTTGTQITITGTFNSTASTTFRVEFFANTAADGSGYGEGRTYLGFTSVTSDGSGNATINTTLTVNVAVGAFVSATATNNTTNNTSEFAQCVTAISPNTAPTITSNGGAATAAVNVAENATAVTTVTATDADLPAQTLTFSISGGADAAKFVINSSTGALSFVAAPDYEAPTDVGGNNVYDVTVRVSDGSLTDAQAIAVTVTDVSSALVVTTVADTNDTGLGPSFTAEQLNASKGTDAAVSLREALIAANTTAGTDAISFAIAGTGVHTINVAAALPTITGTLILDASTDDSFAANGNKPAIVLDGNNSFAGDGLVLSASADGSTIRGLVIRDFSGNGILIQAGSDGNTIAGNYVGQLNATGIIAAAGENNTSSGIRVLGANNTIGGTGALDRNVIGGNIDGVYLTGASANSNTVLNNYIGVDVTGASAIGNSGRGVYVDGGASSNVIGQAGYGNVISGSTNIGVHLVGGANNVIKGNTIGLNAAGSAAISNGAFGLAIDGGASGTIVGGTAAGEGNTISGNTGSTGSAARGGIYVQATGSTIQGNIIGLDASATTAIANGQGAVLNNAGIYIFNGSSNNLIGGTAANAGNIIAGNTGDGIMSLVSGSNVFTALGNRIYGNSEQGIDLADDGVTANDAGDADTGVNNLQNFPVLTTATTTGTQITLTGSLNSTAASYFRIEFFASSTPDASGYGEGQTYLGFLNVSTDGSGNASINTTLTVAVASGQYVCATATKSDASYGTFTDTSEFSQNVVANVAPVVTTTGTTLAYTENAAATAVDPGLTVSDADNASLSSATVRIISNYVNGEDVLAFTDQLGVTGSWNAGTGVLTLSGSATLANYQTVLRSITYANTSDNPSTATRTVSFVVNDGAANSNTATRNISVAAVNDAPLASNLNAAETYTEDTARNLSDIVISDIDSASVTATLTLSSAAAGSLNTGTSGAVTSTFNAGSGVWTASGAIADVNTLLAGLTFTPASNFNTNFTIATSVSDGVAPAVTGSKAMTGTAVNDAPVLGYTGGIGMVGTDENTTSAPTLVSDILITALRSDADVAASSGIAVTSVSANGTFQYSTDGVTWSNFGTVSGSNALLLTSSSRVRYVPDGINGEVASFTFKAWDQTSGTASANGAPQYANPGAGGGASAYSAETGSVVESVSAVNDAPGATNLSAAETYTEDAALNLTDIVITDVDSANVTATLTLSNAAAGSLNTGTSGAVTSTYNAGTGVWSASGAIANVNGLLAGLTFTPAANFNANFTIATSVSDGVAAPVTGSKAMTGTAVNDAPSATNLSAAETYTEDTALNLTDIVISDVDSASVSATLTLSNTAAGSLNTGTSGAVTSTYNAGTGVWTASGAIADVNTLLAGLTFTPASNFNSNFTIATSVSDGVAPAVTGSKAITGTAVNDAPSATNLSTAETYTEDTALNLTDIVISDVDSANVTATLTLSNTAAGSLNTGTSGAVTSNYNAGTGVWTASGAIANVNVLLAGLIFTPAANFNSNFTIATSVSDGVAAPITGSKAMTGTAVNDAPLATNLSTAETYTEDTALNLTDIVISDVDSTNVTATLTLSNTAAGSLNTGTSGAVTSTYNAGTGVWTASGAVADVNALLAGLTFTPATNFNSNFTIATSVSDGVAAPVAGSKAMTGTAVNDAPSASNLSAAETYTEDTTLNLTDIVISDIDSANVTATLTLSNTAAGSLNTATSGAVTLTYNAGTGVWTASGVIADVNALLAGLTFTPAANLNSSFTISTSVSDGVAAPVAGSKAMTGTAVNDAPSASNLSAAETYVEDTPLNLTDIVISDVDSANVTATLTLSNTSAGSLNTGTSGAVTSTYNAGTGVWTAIGAIADVNALLAGLTFTPAANFNSSFAIATSVSDGVAAPVTGSKAMTGTAINDAPSASNLSAAETYTEDTPLNLIDIVIDDVDSANVTATLTLSNTAAGSLNTGTSGAVTSTYNAGTGVWTSSGAIADVNALLAGLTFTPAANFNSDFTIATSVSDGVAAPVTGSKAMTGSAVNDAPIASNLSAAETYTEDTALNLTDIVISDIDSANVTATLTLSNTAAGSLNTGTSGAVTSTYNAGTGVWTASGAIADVNTLLAGLTFIPAANFNSNFTITTSVSDGVAAPVTGSKAMTGTAVNDAPGATNLSAAETYIEDTPLNLTDIVISDVDSANVTATLTLSNTAAGSLNTGTSGAVTSSYNAGTGVWTASGAIADINALLAGLTFTPSANFNGNFTIATSVGDGVAAPLTGSKAMTGTAINDAPSATNLSAAETYTEDTALNLTDIVISDIDSANVTATLTLSNTAAGSLNTGTSGAVTSTYNAGTGVWTASGAIADVNTLLAGLTFTPAANFNSSFTIATSVSDGVAAPVNGSKAMTGSAVNDAPSASNLSAAETYTEDTPLNLTDIVISDVDSASVTATLTLSNTAAGNLNIATSGAVTSTYNAGTGVWIASGAIADVNALLAGLTFTPAANFNSDFSIATSVSDGVAAPVVGSKAMTGTAVNDGPSATNLSAAETYTEDTALNLTDIVISDVDSASVTATLTLSNTAAGSLNTGTSGAVTSTYNAGTGVWTASGAIADVNALLAGLTFTPAADFNSDFTISTSVSDGVAAPVTGSKAMTGTPVNDAPSASNLSAAETFTEDTALSLTDIVISDVDSANVTATLTLSSTAAGGLNTGTSGAVTSTYNAGTGVWTASGAIADVNSLLAGLTFTPAANFNSNFTIATSVSDGVAAPVTGSKAMTGTAVNDAPSATNISAAETYTEDTALNLTDIVISDVDSASVTATLTLSNAAAGSLNTGTSGAVTSTYNAGTGVWTASGAITDVNALLAGMTFTPAANFNSNFTIATSVSDGVAAPVTGSKAMTGTAVNDAPSATNLSAAETYTEDAALNLTDIVISDVDSASVIATLTLSNTAAGSLNTGTSGAVTSTYNAGTGVWTASGAIADVNALLAGLTFTPAANFNSDFAIATSVSDGVAAPVTGSKAMTGTAVNDAPVMTTTGSTLAYTENAAPTVVDGGLTLSDADSASLAGATVSISGGFQTGEDTLGFTDQNGISGSWNSTTGVLTLSGSATVAQYQAALRSITYVNGSDNPSTATRTVSFVVNDGAANSNTGTRDITIAAVNDAPLLGPAGGANTIAENSGAFLLAAPATVSDVDSLDFDGGQLVVAISANGLAEDRLTIRDEGSGAGQVGVSGTDIRYGGVLVGSFNGPVSGSASLIVTFNANADAAVVQAVTRNLTYENLSEAPSAALRTIQGYVTDGDGGTSVSVTGTLSVTPVNDAPTLSNGVLAGVAEDSANPAGQSVATIFAGQFADVDAGASLAGIAVVGNAANAGTQGSWQYSSDAGAHWHAIGAVADGAGALALSSTTLIRFLPVADYHGTPPALTLRGLDDSYAGAYSASGASETRVNVDTGSNGGTTPIAAVTSSVSTSISPVNDAPTTSPVTLAPIAEDSGARLITQTELLVNAIDIDGPSLTATGLAISAGNGGLVDNGNGTWTYTPALNDDASVNFSYTVTDGTASVAASATLDITPVNDAPTTSPVTLVPIAEDSGARLITQAELLANASDIDGPSLTATGLAISAGSGTLVDNGNGTWTYTPAANDDTSVSFTYTVTDGTASVAGSAALDLLPAGDAPVITSNGGAAGAAVGIGENGAAVTSVTASDADVPAQALAYSISGGADAARFVLDATTGALRFIAAPDFETPLDANADNVYDVVVQASDGALTDTQAISVTVGNLNEAPSALTPALALADENAPAGTLVATVSAVDPDAAELFSYALVTDGAGRFAIDAASGRLVVAPGALLDFEAQAGFDLVLRVTDAGGQTYEQALRIDLRDLPETAPAPAPAAPAAEPAPLSPLPTVVLSASAEAAPSAPTEKSADVGRTRAPAPGPAGAQGEPSSLRLPGDADDETRHGSNVARQPLHLRVRDGAEGPLATISFDGVTFDETLPTLSVWDEAKGSIGNLLRNAALRSVLIDADTEHTQAGDERRTPDTLTEMMQDPVRVASVTFTAGFIWWLTRSGGLLTTMLMGVPAWRHVDLLPVLARPADDEDADDEPRHGDDPGTAPAGFDDSAVAELFEPEAGGRRSASTARGVR